jgi:hypothetical protein
MRIGGTIAILISCVACAAKPAPVAAPAPPAAPAPVATADPPAPQAEQPLYRWYCFADVKGAGTDCARSQGECQQAADDWANDGGPGANQSTPCAGQQLAYCYSYVPEDGDKSITLCQQTMDSCHQSAGVSQAQPNTQTDCVETQ